MIQFRNASVFTVCLALSACHYSLINRQADASSSNDKQPVAVLQVPADVHMASAKEARYPVVPGMTQSELEAPVYPPSEESAKPSEMVMEETVPTVASITQDNKAAPTMLTDQVLGNINSKLR